MSLQSDSKKLKFEKDDEEKYCEYVLSRGCLAVKATVRKGWPDRLTLLPTSTTLWMEFKREGEEASKFQHYIHKTLKTLQHKVYLVDNYEEAIAIFEKEYLRATRVSKKSY